MKKTMFITSVIMVVVMAIALTTSSLAWFSAGGSAAVTTQSFKVTAFAGSSEGIAISHKDSQTGAYNWGDSLELTASGNTNLMPLVPFAKTTSSLAEADLLAALVGGHEAKYMTEAEFNADYALFVDDEEEETTAVYEDFYQAFLDDVDAIEDSEDPMYGAELTYANLVAFGYVSPDTIGTVGDEGADYAAYMIGNKYDNNQLFTNNVYRSGFYTDTFYITNLAEGENAEAINLDTEIKFSFKKWVDVNDDPDVEDLQELTFDYTRALRQSTYDTDATLCVAVLAKVSEFDTNMITYLNGKSVSTIHDAAGDAWEIIAFADSKHYQSSAALVDGNIAMGKTSAYFEKGATVANCLSYVGKTGLNKTNTEPLRPERIYELKEADLIAAREALEDENLNIASGDTLGDEDEGIAATGVTLPADVKTIKVIAWYDGATLNNNNATAADLMFDLRFSIAD